MNLTKAIQDNIAVEIDSIETELKDTIDKVAELSIHLAKLYAHQTLTLAFEQQKDNVTK